VPSQRAAVDLGALHPDPIELTVSGHPPQQRPVARGGVGEPLITELPTDLVEHDRAVRFAVSIDAARDRACRKAASRRLAEANPARDLPASR